MALEAFAAHMPAGVQWTRPQGGFFAWISLPAPLRAADVVDRARGMGVWLLAGDPFFAEQPTGQYLRLAYSYLPPERIVQGIQVLGRCLLGAGGAEAPPDAV